MQPMTASLSNKRKRRVCCSQVEVGILRMNAAPRIEGAASTQYSHPIMSRVVPSKSCARGWTLPDPNHKTGGISDFPQTQNPITQVARRPAMAVVLLPNNDDNEEDD